jgi:GNAT superfamily N-acetyltransferase
MTATPSELVSVCERVQTEWFRVRAEQLGGAAWHDGELFWTDGPDGLNLMFPTAIPLNSLLRGVEHAEINKRTPVGVWLSLETDASNLATAGFERGWAPWWMTAQLDTMRAPKDPRVHLGPSPEDLADDPQSGAVRLAALEPERAFFAAARVEGKLVGHAWSFVDGDVAGVFDMVVWPEARRRGLGAALLQTVCAAAREAGAKTAALNATPQGALLCRAQGFRRVGEGATWWLHLKH